MPATKTARTLQASVSVAAAGTQNGTESNQSTAYGAVVTAKITNGATGPTIGCDFVVYVGEATTVKREFSRQTAPTTNSAVTEFVVEVPPGTMFVNVTFTGHTAQAVTVESHLQELSTI